MGWPVGNIHASIRFYPLSVLSSRPGWLFGNPFRELKWHCKYSGASRRINLLIRNPLINPWIGLLYYCVHTFYDRWWCCNVLCLISPPAVQNGSAVFKCWSIFNIKVKFHHSRLTPTTTAPSVCHDQNTYSTPLAYAHLFLALVWINIK